MESEIEVYILCTQRNRCATRSDLTNLFSNPRFKINFIANNNATDPALQAIRDASQTSPGKSIILVKDSAMSSSSSRIIDKVIAASDEMRGWDILYLGGIGSDCGSNTSVTQVAGTSVSLISTKSLSDWSAILIPSHTIDMLLGVRKLSDGQNFIIPEGLSFNDTIQHDGLKVLNVYPPIFMPDVASSNPNDFVICRTLNEPAQPEAGFNWVPIIAFILIFGLLAMIAYYIYHKKKSTTVRLPPTPS